MSDNKSRVRTRLVPAPSAVTTPLGYFQSRNSLSSPWNAPNFFQSYSGIGGRGYPGLTCERTWDENHGHPPYRSGGPFQSIKINSCQPNLNNVNVQLEPVLAKGTYMRGDNLERYVGGFMPPTSSDFGSGFDITPFDNFLKKDSPLLVDLSTYGDQAYAKLRPKLEQASGLVFLAEFGDTPRMLKTTGSAFQNLWRTAIGSRKAAAKGFHDTWKFLGGRTVGRIMRPKPVADHFLNHQFGWVPFLNDLEGFYKTYSDMEVLIAKLTAQNNQFVRKRATIAKSETIALVGSNPFVSGNICFPNTYMDSTAWCNGGPFHYLVDRTTTTITASGKFRYYRPEFDLTRTDYSSAMRSIQRQLTLYGLRISPSNIYKATPWTWAADWISNAGKLIDRANDYLLDSVASQYLFVSSHVKKERLLIQIIPFKNAYTILSFSRHFDVKQRQEDASPYGFNLSVSNLTARQLAIAGALGITRW